MINKYLKKYFIDNYSKINIKRSVFISLIISIIISIKYPYTALITLCGITLDIYLERLK